MASYVKKPHTVMTNLGIRRRYARHPLRGRVRSTRWNGRGPTHPRGCGLTLTLEHTSTVSTFASNNFRRIVRTLVLHAILVCEHIHVHVSEQLCVWLMKMMYKSDYGWIC